MNEAFTKNLRLQAPFVPMLSKGLTNMEAEISYLDQDGEPLLSAPIEIAGALFTCLSNKKLVKTPEVSENGGLGVFGVTGYSEELRDAICRCLKEMQVVVTGEPTEGDKTWDIEV